ncbi:MAG: PLP-dependent aminotransferase family protein [Faecalibacillus sp.]
MTKYETIASYIETKIMNLEYSQGDKLPSLKQMMQQFHCSKATVIKAYEQLQKKHLIYVLHQSGFYVADNGIKPAYLDDFYPLNTGNPIVSHTSLEDAKHCLSIAIDQYSYSSLNLSLQGVESLLDILPDFLGDLSVYVKKDCIYLIQGITQMLSFITLSKAFQNKEYILIEEPTYSYFVDFLKEMHIPTLIIQRDENGIDIYELERLFQNYPIRFFYTIPRNHNPLGTILKTSIRKKIAQLSLKYNVYIIEDDYFGHCSSTTRYLPIYYYTAGRNCIYLTSFSKTMPFIRIGICVIPQDFQKDFNKITHQSYYFSYQLPSLISQATFEAYISSHLYQKQVQRLQKQFQKHFQIIQQKKKEWDPNIISIIGGTSGYYFSLQLNQNIDLNLLIQKLKKEKIYVARNERCFFHQEHFNQTIRLSIARIEPKQLEEALDIIYQNVLSLLKKKS